MITNSDRKRKELKFDQWLKASPYFAAAALLGLITIFAQLPTYVPFAFSFVCLVLVILIQYVPGFGAFLEYPVATMKGSITDPKAGLVAVVVVMGLGILFFGIFLIVLIINMV